MPIHNGLLVHYYVCVSVNTHNVACQLEGNFRFFKHQLLVLHVLLYLSIMSFWPHSSNLYKFFLLFLYIIFHFFCGYDLTIHIFLVILYYYFSFH